MVNQEFSQLLQGDKLLQYKLCIVLICFSVLMGLLTDRKVTHFKLDNIIATAPDSHIDNKIIEAMQLEEAKRKLILKILRRSDSYSNYIYDLYKKDKELQVSLEIAIFLVFLIILLLFDIVLYLKKISRVSRGQVEAPPR